jgi:hypothetical protein
MLVGIVKINYDPGYEFLRRIRSEMVHKIPDRTEVSKVRKIKEAERKKEKSVGQWEGEPYSETNL